MAVQISSDQVMTHKLPYNHIKHGSEVVIRSSKGELPKRPNESRVVERGLDDKLWNLLLECWSKNAGERPTIENVLTRLE